MRMCGWAGLNKPSLVANESSIKTLCSSSFRVLSYQNVPKEPKICVLIVLIASAVI